MRQQCNILIQVVTDIKMAQPESRLEHCSRSTLHMVMVCSILLSDPGYHHIQYKDKSLLVYFLKQW